MAESENRRLIVGTDRTGRSTIARDDHDLAQTQPLTGFSLQEIWSQESVPGSRADAGLRAGAIGIEPPAAGALVRILTISALGPEDEWVPNLHGDNNRHVLTVVSGTVDLILEDNVTTMHTGDSVVMSGHIHDWRNTYGVPAVLVYTSFPLVRG